MEVAKVMTYGAKKYDKHNWRGGFDWTRLSDASLRHIHQWLEGQDKDPETEISHLAHAVCGLMMLIEHELKELGNDDRYKA